MTSMTIGVVLPSGQVTGKSDQPYSTLPDPIDVNGPEKEGGVHGCHGSPGRCGSGFKSLKSSRRSGHEMIGTYLMLKKHATIVHRFFPDPRTRLGRWQLCQRIIELPAQSCTFKGFAAVPGVQVLLPLLSFVLGFVPVIALLLGEGRESIHTFFDKI